MPDFELFFVLADASFGINRQALATLQYLAYQEIQGIEPPEYVATQPMLMDGCWGVLCIYRKTAKANEPYLLIWVGEDSVKKIRVVSTVVKSMHDASTGWTHYDLKGGNEHLMIEGAVLEATQYVTSTLFSYMMS